MKSPCGQITASTDNLSRNSTTTCSARQQLVYDLRIAGATTITSTIEPLGETVGRDHRRPSRDGASAGSAETHRPSW